MNQELPSSTESERYPIAVVGAGGIVNQGHLPAYRRSGFAVAGIFDVDGQRARATAKRFEVPKVYADLDEVLADSAVKIVDLAVPPGVQETILPRVIAAGRHALCQKPLARDLATAQRLADAADRAGVILAVNVSMRWSPAIRFLRNRIAAGRLGDFVSASFRARCLADWSQWPWLKDSPRLTVLYNTIHFVDALRFLGGEPESVYALGRRASSMPGESETVISFRYASGAIAYIHDNCANSAGGSEAIVRVEGTRETVEGRLGFWYNYPDGTADSVRVCGQDPIELPGRWIPDGFAWTMAELISAIHSDRKPANSAADHLATLGWIERIYHSMETGRAVDSGPLIS